MLFDDLCKEVQKLLKDTKPGGMVSRLKKAPIALDFMEIYKNIKTTFDANKLINIEKVYLCMHNLKDIPIAECGSECRFGTYPTGYSEYCKLPKFNHLDEDGNILQEKCQFCHDKFQSKKDQTNAKDGIIKAVQTYARNLGLDNPEQYTNMSQIPQIKELRKNTKFAKDKEYQKELRDINVKKHGGEEKYREHLRATTKDYYAKLSEARLLELTSYNSATRKANYIKKIVASIDDVLEFKSDISLYNGVGYKDKYSFMCRICSHEFVAPILSTQLPQCPACKSKEIKSKSKEEDSFYSYIAGLTTAPIVRNTRSILPSGLELDIYIPTLKIAFEYNGIYWHSDKYVLNNKHQNKTIECRKLGIKLITVFSDDWLFKNARVKQRLDSFLGVNTSIYARKCTIKEVQYSDSQKFLELYHLQGNCSSSIRYGLYYNDELYALMAFGKNRFSKNSLDTDYELLRYCSKVNVIGGCSKLFKYFITAINPTEVVSFADLEYGYGDVYLHLGFAFDSITAPAYSYVHVNKSYRENRIKYQKHKLVQEGFNPVLSEREIMESRGFYRVYNCGNARYLWRR